MEKHYEIQKDRDIYIDNIKSILIFLVVLGHFLDQCITGSTVSKAIYIFIYSFHMPLFIFLNGFLGKSLIQNRQRVIQKVSYFFILYVLLKLCIFGVKLIFGKAPSFHLLEEGGIPWYLFAVGVYYCICNLLRNINSKWLLMVAFVIGSISGYDRDIGDFLVLSRIIVFFPFFVLGWITQPDTLRSVRNKHVKCCMIIILFLFLTGCFLFTEQVYFLRPLFTGRHSFKVLDELFYYGFFYRILTYALSISISLAVMSVTPSISLKVFTLVGRRTLAIYMWHRVIIYALVYGNVYKYLEQTLGWRWGRAAWLMVGVVLTLILISPIFEKPLIFLKSEKFMEEST